MSKKNKKPRQKVFLAVDRLRAKFLIFLISLYKQIDSILPCLFSYRSQKTLKCGKSISYTLACGSCATFLFLPHFDVMCDLKLNRHKAKWNLFVK